MTFLERRLDIQKMSVYECVVILTLLNSQMLIHAVFLLSFSISYIMPVHFICHNDTINISCIHIDKK